VRHRLENVACRAASRCTAAGLNNPPWPGKRRVRVALRHACVHCRRHTMAAGNVACVSRDRVWPVAESISTSTGGARASLPTAPTAGGDGGRRAGHGRECVGAALAGCPGVSVGIELRSERSAARRSNGWRVVVSVLFAAQMSSS
jgi:hypothetical protein